MARIIHMYHKITIRLRGPPAIWNPTKASPPFFRYVMIFPHYEYWGAAATRDIS